MNNPDAKADIFEAAMAALKAEEGERTPACLTEDEMQRLLERRYFLFKRRRMWKHVVSCAYCRQHSRDMQLWLSIPAEEDNPVSATASSAPTWSTVLRTRKAALAGASAFAVVGLLLMFQHRGISLDSLTVSERKVFETAFVQPPDSTLATGLDMTDNQRGSPTGESSKYPVQQISPVGVVVADERPLLRWAPFPGALSYSVEIRDYEDNKLMLSRETRETSYRLAPTDTALGRGHLYRWQVTAYLPGHREKLSPNTPFAVLDMAKMGRLASLRARLGPVTDAQTHLWLAERFRDALMLDDAAEQAGLVLPGDPLYPKAQALLKGIHRN